LIFSNSFFSSKSNIGSSLKLHFNQSGISDFVSFISVFSGLKVVLSSNLLVSVTKSEFVNKSSFVEKSLLKSNSFSSLKISDSCTHNISSTFSSCIILFFLPEVLSQTNCTKLIFLSSLTNL